MLDVVEHPDPQQQLVVVAVQVFAVTPVQEHIAVVLLLLHPGRAVRRRRSRPGPRLLPLPAARHRGGQAGVALTDLGYSRVSKCGNLILQTPPAGFLFKYLNKYLITSTSPQKNEKILCNFSTQGCYCLSPCCPRTLKV